MKISRHIASLMLVLSIALSACNITINTGTEESTPQTNVIVITATQPAQAPSATATSTPEQPAPQLPPPPTTPTVTPANVLHFYVSGFVWSDHCSVIDGPKPNPLPAGCIDRSNGSYGANGIFEAGELGIPGVTVKIELNCNYGAFTAVTDANGHYTMSFTVDANAGVSKQRICLSVDALSPANLGILVPGGWSSPLLESSAIAIIDLTIPVEDHTNIINFGWDYQFD